MARCARDLGEAFRHLRTTGAGFKTKTLESRAGACDGPIWAREGLFWRGPEIAGDTQLGLAAARHSAPRSGRQPRRIVESAAIKRLVQMPSPTVSYNCGDEYPDNALTMLQLVAIRSAKATI